MATGTGVYIPTTMLGDVAATASLVLRGDSTWGVLPYAALPATHGFAARRDANAITFNTGAYTTCTYDVEEADTDSAFVHTSGEYTAPATGFYLFTAKDKVGGIDDGESAILALYVDGALKYNGERAFSPGAGLSIHTTVNAVLYLTAAQVVTCRLWHDEGANQAQLLAAGDNWFSGVRLA